MRRFWPILVLLLILMSSAANAQCPTTGSTPQFTTGGSVFGRIAAQWNSYFGAKADANNGILCNPTIIGGTQPGAFTVGPGLTNLQGTRNPGSNQISSGALLSRQLWPVQKSSSYVVNSDSGGVSDSGALIIAAGSSVTFTLPQPSSGTKGVSYHFGSDGTNPFTLDTAGMTALFYGCPGPGSGATSYTFGVGAAVALVDDGTNYNCAVTATTEACGDTAYGLLDCPQLWTKGQRGKQEDVELSGSTFTFDLDAAQHFDLLLDHGACPCTIATPTNAASAAGQVGMIGITQSSSGNDSVSWGSVWKFSNGNTPVLSTGASAIDYLSYYVQDATHIIVAPGVLNAQ